MYVGGRDGIQTFRHEQGDGIVTFSGKVNLRNVDASEKSINRRDLSTNLYLVGHGKAAYLSLFTDAPLTIPARTTP